MVRIGKTIDVGGADVVAQLAALGLQLRSLRCDGDRLVGLSNLQREIHAERGRRDHLHARPEFFLESRRRDGNLVGAGRQLRNRVIAGGGSRGFIDYAGVGAFGFDRRAGDNSAGGIGNCSSNRARAA